MENRIMSQNLEDLSGLDSPPIAIKIVKIEDPLRNIEEPIKRSRYYQLLMLARKGQDLMLNAEIQHSEPYLGVFGNVNRGKAKSV